MSDRPDTGSQFGLAFSVYGMPVPKQSVKAGKHSFYTPARMVAWEDCVRLAAQQAVAQIWQFQPYPGPVEVWLVFSGARRNSDPDNLSKGTLDGLKGVVVVDDKQVQQLHISKLGRGEPGVHIRVYPIEED